MTSHQLFQQLLARHGPTDTLKVRVLEYTVKIDQPLVTVDVLDGRASDLVLDINWKKAKQVKKRTALPFGLKMSPKKRRRNNTSQSKGSSSSKNPSIKEVLLLMGAKHIGDQGSSSESDSDSMLQGGASDRDADTSDDSDTAGEERAANPDQRFEEKETRQVLRAREALMQERDQDEVQTVPCAGHDSGPVVNPATSAPSNLRGKGLTQCNSYIGLCEVGTQISGKLASCRFCNAKISRGGSRLAYSFSKVKFHAWVHLECFPQYLQQQKGDPSQALAFINDWLHQNAGSSSDLRKNLEDLVPKLENAACVRRW